MEDFLLSLLFAFKAKDFYNKSNLGLIVATDSGALKNFSSQCGSMPLSEKFFSMKRFFFERVREFYIATYQSLEKE